MSAQNPKRTKSDFMQGIRQRIDHAPETVSQFNESLEQFARKQPLIAAITALAGGFLIGRVLARR